MSLFKTFWVSLRPFQFYNAHWFFFVHQSCLICFKVTRDLHFESQCAFFRPPIFCLYTSLGPFDPQWTLLNTNEPFWALLYTNILWPLLHDYLQCLLNTNCMRWGSRELYIHHTTSLPLQLSLYHSSIKNNRTSH